MFNNNTSVSNSRIYDISVITLYIGLKKKWSWWNLYIDPEVHGELTKS